MNETYHRSEVDILGNCKMQTSTMTKAEFASTIHSVNDANPQPTILKQLTIISIDTCSFLRCSC